MHSVYRMHVEIEQDGMGRRYAKIGKRKYYVPKRIKKGKSTLEFVKWVMKHFTRRRQRRQPTRLNQGRELVKNRYQGRDHKTQLAIKNNENAQYQDLRNLPVVNYVNRIREQSSLPPLIQQNELLTKQVKKQKSEIDSTRDAIARKALAEEAKVAELRRDAKKLGIATYVNGSHLKKSELINELIKKGHRGTIDKYKDKSGLFSPKKESQSKPKRIVEEEEDYDQGDEKEQEGSGKGLTNEQIDRYMKYHKDYLGTIASDQIPSRILPNIKPQSKGAWIQNTQPSNMPGEHWVAVFFDARPHGSHSIEYFNSFGVHAPERFKREIKMVAKALQPETYLKFKENRVQLQDNNTDTCGFHAMKFIIDRERGKSFAEASRYSDRKKDDHVAGEKSVDNFIHRLEQKGFGYINHLSMEGEGIAEVAEAVVKKGKDILSAIQGIRTKAGPSFRKFIETNGEAKITSITVSRKPIISAVDRVANLISLGKWEQNKQKLGYDKMFHLFMTIKLSNGKTFKLEKNHVPQISAATAKATDQEDMSARAPSVTLAQFIAKGERSAGGERFWVYDSITANCQKFVEWCLKGSRVWSPALSKFVLQDAEAVIKGFSWFKDLARKATDLANRADVAIEGNGMVQVGGVKLSGRTNFAPKTGERYIQNQPSKTIKPIKTSSSKEPPRVYIPDNSDAVEIKKVGKKGYGLFAKRDLAENTRFVYGGKWIDKKEYERREDEDEADYIADTGNAGLFIDANPKYSFANRWALRINEPTRGEKAGENTVLGKERDPTGKHRWRPVMIVARNIKKGEELLALYGEDYNRKGLYRAGKKIKRPKWLKKEVV